MNEQELQFVEQILEDAFHASTSILNFTDTDSSTIDGGIRNLVWGNFPIDSRVPALMLNIDTYRIIVFKSKLGFYSVSCSLSLGESPEYLSIGPLTAEAYTPISIQNIVRANNFPPQKLSDIYNYYYRLPVAKVEDVTMTIRHLLTRFIPEFQNATVEYIDFKDNTNEVQINAERMQRFSSDSAEKTQRLLLDYMKAIDNSDSNTAVSLIRSILDFTIGSASTKMMDARRVLTTVNSILLYHLMESSIHPFYSLKFHNQMALQIERSRSIDDIRTTGFTMTHKACLLVKNYSFSEYSHLIRKVINYIDQNLAEDLSLSILAQVVEKNASYLSAQFNREVGCSLTDYIHKTRIRESLKYLTTTDIAISDIAELVGFTDVGYYTRIFKKHIGNTPSEYRKMLQ